MPHRKGAQLNHMTPRLDGHTVVITGAAGGQGACEAELLAKLGAQVIAVDVTTAEPQTELHPNIRFSVLDVTCEEDWALLHAQLSAALKDEPLRALINNAGITHRARLGEIERADWDRVLGVNLTGPMLGIQALAPLMGEGSSIINVGSAAGLTAHYPVAYTASKWGLRGLTHVAATEYGPRGIRVNIVHPGFIETTMTANAPSAMRAAQLALTPMERMGESEHVAQTVAFLVSDAAGYISGAEIPVDGAFTSSAGVKYMSDRIRQG